MQAWKIEGYELAVMQCLYEGHSPKSFNYATLESKGLVAESFGFHQLTVAGKRVLECIIDHLNNFDAGDEVANDPTELVQHVDVEFEDDDVELEDACYISATPV